ncbi:2Fe-2S iron-sulfur cluster-binding protein [Ferrovibrio sp.]|uniref:2Fe-2S iron-sulfur cluster-binding protein n=1 Tax=Ferrovibrio sp. TaxID=1917215 RepID=UPI00311E3117
MTQSDERLRPTRRAILGTTGAATAFAAGGMLLTAPEPTAAQTSAPQTADGVPLSLNVNGRSHALKLDARTTLLDALRDHLQLTGTKKGCDHGQCGACTVLIDGRRINSCLTLAVMHDGEQITTVEGLAVGGRLHPMQAAFVARDGFQCGYCTSGHICSAVGMLAEVEKGWPSHVTDDVAKPVALNDAEIQERMSGNLCRCAAYPNIVAAIKDAASPGRTSTAGGGVVL